MKKILLAFAIYFVTSFVTNAQTPPLNKQQTIEYIDKEYKNAFKRPSQPTFKIIKVELDKKILVRTFENGDRARNDLSNLTNLKVEKFSRLSSELGNGLYYIVEEGKEIENSLLGFIELELDANRLKKALEHLIKLVKTEKSIDPFED